MSLNIKDPHVHQLARRAAQVTGKSQTRAVEEALERLLGHYDAHPAATERQERLEVLRQIRLEWQGDRGVDVEDLYDADTGLPA